MRKHIIETAAHEVATQIRTVEDCIEDALAEIADLQGKMIRARASAGMSPPRRVTPPSNSLQPRSRRSSRHAAEWPIATAHWSMPANSSPAFAPYRGAMARNARRSPRPTCVSSRNRALTGPQRCGPVPTVMGTHQIFFWAFLALSCGYALWRGRSDERIVAAACLVASIATRFAISPLQSRYASVESGLVMIDLLMLLAFIWIALNSQRFWPLWVAGFQLTNSISHLMKFADLQLMPRAYGAAAAVWSYPILLVLAIGTWRSHNRGPDDSHLSLR